MWCMIRVVIRPSQSRFVIHNSNSRFPGVTMADRYLRIVLTIIAVELGWLGVKDVVPASVAAQAQPAATRVVITGVDLPARTQFLPVAVTGGVRGVASPSWASP